MKVFLIVVGRVRAPLADAVREYETRAARYHAFEVVEVKEGKGGGRSPEEVMAEEGARLDAAIPDHFRVVALDRAGSEWSSEHLARRLSDWALQSEAGVAFVIGGAYGLSAELLRRSDINLSLSQMTLPHEMARLVIAEQVYRAGTIQRGEPYHKGRTG